MSIHNRKSLSVENNGNPRKTMTHIVDQLIDFSGNDNLARITIFIRIDKTKLLESDPFQKFEGHIHYRCCT